MRRPALTDLSARALATIEDAITRAQQSGPLRGEEPGLRLALAFLFAIASDETDYPQPAETPFVELWTVLTGQPNAMCDRNTEFRTSWAWTQIAAIRRRVGAVRSDCAHPAIQRRMTEQARQRLAQMIREVAAQAASERNARRLANSCDLDRYGDSHIGDCPGRKR